MPQFLKLYPGDKDFKEVSEREWDAPFEPFKDQNGHGNILGLTADVRVFDRPGGKIVVAKKWPSRSFIRNFGRTLRSIFAGTSIAIFDSVAGSFETTVGGSTAFQSGGAAVLPRRSAIIGTAAALAVGDGAGAEDHTYNDLLSRVGPIVPASDGVSTTLDNATTLTFQITQGITIAQSGGITAREIGMYIRFRRKFGSPDPTTVEGTPSLVAYDQIAATPVAQGGVIAPRYTLNFPV